MVDLNTNSHSLIHVMVWMISRILAVVQLVEPYKQLSGLHYMEKNDRNLLANFHRYIIIKAFCERLCSLYVEDVSKIIQVVGKVIKQSQKLCMIMPTLNNYSPFICRIVLNRLWSNIT